MKISFVISTQPTQFQAVTFSPDFAANAAHLAELGYDGIELAIREPALLDLAAVRQVLDQYHLRVPAIGTGQAWGDEHLSFTDPDPAVRDRALARILAHLPVARELDAIVILGLIRGVVQPQVAPDQAHRWLVDALSRLSDSAQQSNVRLMIEPINRYETNLLNNVAETNALLDEIGGDRLGILYDTFHSNIEESHLEENLNACGARLFHVHLADSNRWAPGFGHINFASIIATLRQMNYRGWVSAEILPRPDLLTAQERAITTMRPLLRD